MFCFATKHNVSPKWKSTLSMFKRYLAQNKMFRAFQIFWPRNMNIYIDIGWPKKFFGQKKKFGHLITFMATQF